ncbi:nicotinamide mononucleotide transporter [Blattabacterium cuenoti]|uniref:nicotinamide mononucleotide transporter n=1 Tax=Blattabacterium cuenoti TaxID=1653831 RepID=UPI00163BBF99|nr:nicotinamide mononucleotide transporter [Blattabacterium cuenoti]
MFLLHYHNEKCWIYLTLDLISIFFTIISTFLSIKYNTWAYPSFIMSYIISSYSTYKNHLYGNFIMKIYYIMINLYGWLLWMNKKNKKISITFCKKKDYIQTFVLFFITCVLNIIVLSLNVKNDENNFNNIIINGLNFSRMYQMAIKKVENWIICIIINILSIFFSSFYSKIIIVIIIYLSVEGFYFWKKEAMKLKSKNLN